MYKCSNNCNTPPKIRNTSTINMTSKRTASMMSRAVLNMRPLDKNISRRPRNMKGHRLISSAVIAPLRILHAPRSVENKQLIIIPIPLICAKHERITSGGDMARVGTNNVFCKSTLGERNQYGWLTGGRILGDMYYVFHQTFFARP